MNSLSSSLRRIGPHLSSGLARPILGFMAWGWAVWTALLVLDTAERGSGSALSTQDLAHLLEVATRQVSTLAIAGGLLTAIARVGRVGHWLAWGVLTAAAAYASWDQALFLTSGDRVSEHPQVAAIRLGLAVALTLVILASWAWMRPAFTGRAFASRWRAWAWYLVGAAALVGGFSVVRRELAAYAYFAAFGTFFVAAAAAALVARLGSRRPGLVIGASIGSVAFALSAWTTRNQEANLPGGSLGEFAESVVGPRPSTEVARLDFDNVARFRCRASSETRAESSLPLATDRRRHVLLISVDSLRKDMLRAVESGRPVMPELSRFAQGSIEFQRAQAPYPATLYSLGAAFTGYSPSELMLAPTIPENIFHRARGRFDLVAQLLPSNKWFRTPAIDKFIIQDARARKLPDARRQTDALIDLLRDARAEGRRVFTWVHYLEPHEPYHQDDEFDFGEERRARYLSEVARVDHEIGRLLAFLEEDGWFRDSLVVIFADHGEALGEGDYWGHHVYLRQEIIDVPLLLRYPGHTPRVVNEVVGLADIAPTVLDFAGMSRPSPLGARSLFDTLKKPAPRPSISEAFPVRGMNLMKMSARRLSTVDELKERVEDIYEEGAKSYDPKVAIVKGPYRLIVNRRTAARELYDARLSEKRNVQAAHPDVVDELEESLAEWHERQSERIYCRVMAKSR